MEIENNTPGLMETEAITLELESFKSQTRNSQSESLIPQTIEKQCDTSQNNQFTSQSETKIVESETMVELELKLSEPTDIFTESVDFESNKKQIETNETELVSQNQIEINSESSMVEAPKKRSLEEELEPLLIRLPSSEPSCGSDFIRIKKTNFKIGRKPDNDEVILDVLISRNHCIIHKEEEGNQWLITNLSSTDTLLNGQSIERNQTKILDKGDILQLSLADTFKYEFHLVKKEEQCSKLSKLELNENNHNLNAVLREQKSFVEMHTNERKDLEVKLNLKQVEQVNLKLQLNELLKDKKVSKNCQEDLNNKIKELQSKIEVVNQSELELQQKYKDLLIKLEEEKLKFEEKLSIEKLKVQEAIKESKQEKEKFEMQMEEFKEQLTKKQQEEWQEKITKLLDDEKSVQTKLQDEKLLLEQKLKEMEDIIKKKEEDQKQQQQEAAAAVAKATKLPALDLRKCIILKLNKCPKNVKELPVLETIDLTGGTEVISRASTSAPTSSPICPKIPQRGAVIDRVSSIMDEQLTCCICSELLVRAVTTNCNHTFCEFCIESWFRRQKQCPNCRENIYTRTRSLVIDSFIDKMLESFTPEQMKKRRELIAERQKKKPILKKKIIKKR